MVNKQKFLCLTRCKRKDAKNSNQKFPLINNHPKSKELTNLIQ